MAEEPKAGYACFSSQFFQHVAKKITARSQISFYIRQDRRPNRRQSQKAI